MSAKIIDGKAISLDIKQEVKKQTEQLKQKGIKNIRKTTRSGRMKWGEGGNKP